MEYLLFVFYLVLFAWLVTKVKFFIKTGLSKPQLISLFLLKVIAGIFYGWIGTYYGGLAQMYDTWVYHNQGIVEYNLLFSDPLTYLTNIFHNPYQGGASQFLAGYDSYWNDLKGNTFIKIVSIFNLFTFGNYFVNVILYSFVTLFGPIAFYRVMQDVYPRKKTVVLLFSFLIPSFLYWTSGLHKEGIIFTGIAMVTYSIYFGLQQNKWSPLRILVILLGLTVILTLRNFIIIIFIPAILTWFIAGKIPQHTTKIFWISYSVFVVLFFSLRYCSPKLDFPQAVVNKQQDFLKHQGPTSVPINILEPTVVSFVKNTPQAINLSVVRPYPSDVKHLPSLAATIEISFLILIVLLSFIFKDTSQRPNHFIYYCFFFGVSLLLSIGFSQNNIGAIVRYRSIALPLLIIPFAASINWEKLRGIIKKIFKQ
ncbi:MAG: hypothetical protein RL115_2519 [Bacteroidota bacterium]